MRDWLEGPNLFGHLDRELRRCFYESMLIALINPDRWSGISIFLSALYVRHPDKVAPYFTNPDALRRMADVVYPEKWRGDLSARKAFSTDALKGLGAGRLTQSEREEAEKAMQGLLGRPLTQSERKELESAEVGIDAADCIIALGLLRDAIKLAASDGREHAGFHDVLTALRQSEEFGRILQVQHRLAMRG